MSLDDKVQIIKASVSNIVYTLIPSEFRFFSAMYRGNALHYKLGYMNTLKFTRYLELDDYIVVVSGVPDKIDYENRCVRELKTSRNGLSEKQTLRAKMQLLLYTWLTGLNIGYLDVYNMKDEKLHLAVLEVERNDGLTAEILKDYIDTLKGKTKLYEYFKQKYG